MTSRIQPELITAYSETVITIRIDDFHHVAIKGCSDISNSLRLQDLMKKNFYELWVITAENPFSQQLSDEDNFQRQQSLFNELSEKGIEVFEALCSSPDGSWSENSFAIPSEVDNALNNQEVIYEQAQSFGQNAVFKITSSNLRVISTLSGDSNEMAEVLFKSNYSCELI